VNIALIVVDMLNHDDHPDAEPLMESVRGSLPAMRRLIDAAREHEILTVYVNDNHGDWSASAATLSERALGGPDRSLVEPIVPADDVPFVIKARHSIFYETQVEYLLRRHEIRRLVLIGQVTEQCILYSALDAYVRHFEVVVVPEAVAHIHADLADAALRLMETNMRAQMAPADARALAADEASNADSGRSPAERAGNPPSSTTREADMAKTARDVMSGGAECIGENESMLDAARQMAELDVGAMPICGEDDRLKGMVTDRDIVVKVLAQGKDPAHTRAGELAQGKPVTIGADDSVEEALHTMAEHKVRRLPVIDGHRLIGVVSQGDLAKAVDEQQVGELVEAISSAP
jgi:nicotinamidase-related amidase/CBS domain-containing protein